MEKEAYLRQQRALRIAALQGKYLIIADSPRHPGQIMYIQDQKICNKGFWTSFIANAKGFTKEEAEAMLKKLKYNNPRIMRLA